uniref:Uncharacterized protein n=1 Tax=Oryza glaberrima TaxID=4538 RepID=I1PLM6_ORYGL
GWSRGGREFPWIPRLYRSQPLAMTPSMAQERGEPLLQSGNGAAGGGAKGSPPPALARTVLKVLMWAVFLTWAAAIFFYPTKPAQAAFEGWMAATKQSLFGIT